MASSLSLNRIPKSIGKNLSQVGNSNLTKSKWGAWSSTVLQWQQHYNDFFSESNSNQSEYDYDNVENNGRNFSSGLSQSDIVDIGGSMDAIDEFDSQQFRSLRKLIESTRISREKRPGIDQSVLQIPKIRNPTSDLESETDSTFEHPVSSATKVIYLVLPRHKGLTSTGLLSSGNLLIQATRSTAAHDVISMLARAHYNGSFSKGGNGNNFSDNNSTGGGINLSKNQFFLRASGCNDPGRNLLVLPLESLKSDKFFFGGMHEDRLNYWRKVLGSDSESEFGLM